MRAPATREPTLTDVLLTFGITHGPSHPDGVRLLTDRDGRTLGRMRAEECWALIRLMTPMVEALRTTAGNIRSLGPAGALDRVPMEYQRWLSMVEAALPVEGRP